MAKQIVFTYEDKEYTLEFTRRTVKQMEDEGFVAQDIDRKPMTLLPALFAGAFKAHHRFVKQDVIDKIYAGMPHKDEEEENHKKLNAGKEAMKQIMAGVNSKFKRKEE